MTLRANTTVKSRSRLRDTVRQHLIDILLRFEHIKRKNRVCDGDFFHDHSNPEEVIDSAWIPYGMTGKILAGNHDLLAHNDKIGSLVFMDRTAKSITSGDYRTHVIYGELGKPHAEIVTDIDGMTAVFVPHVYTQELFEKSLRGVKKQAAGLKEEHGLPLVLFLHCNVDSGFAEGHDISLNLTTEMAKDLLAAGVDYIVCGHEHEPRNLLEGRLLIVGNTHPTQFGDIGTKRVLVFDDGKFTSEVVYLESNHYREVDWRVLQEELAGGPLNANTQWLRLTGNAQASDVVELSKVIKACWETGLGLFAVKSDVAIAGFTAVNKDEIQIANLAQIVSEELKNLPDLLTLWNEILTGARQ